MSGIGQSDAADWFERKSATFLHWFHSSAGTRASHKIRIADLRSQGAGRGLVAAEHLSADEELFAVPRNLVLDAAHSPIKDLLEEHLSAEDNWLPLIVAIIHEHLHRYASSWQPYLDILPTTFDTLMFWSDTELAELQASEVVNKVGKAAAEDKWKDTIIPLMRSRPDMFPLKSTSLDEDAQVQELVQLAHWAGSLIMAYAFDIDQDEDTEKEQQAVPDEDGFVEEDEEQPSIKGMVPFADLLNADAERNNARLFQEGDYLIMRTTTEVQAGAEIFNDYGPLPRADLLRMYGYTTANYAQYDVAEISYALIEQVAHTTSNKIKKDQIRMLDELGLLEDGYAMTRPRPASKLDGVIPGSLHMLLRAMCGGLGSQQSTTYDSKEPLTVQEAALLAAVCTKRLTEYKTILTEDQAILQGLAKETTPPAAKRLRVALEVRMGEKQILHSLLARLQDHISQATSNIAHGSTKRKHDEEDGANHGKRSKTSPKAKINKA